MRKPSAPLWPAYTRVPPFLPVPLRQRSDGWTAARQGLFIGTLAQTGSVAAAAKAAGMSRMAAYRLRRATGAESLAQVWDHVLAVRAGEGQPPSRKVTPEQLLEWALLGPIVVTMRRGRFVRAERKPCNSALLRCLAQFDRHGGLDAGDRIR